MKIFKLLFVVICMCFILVGCGCNRKEKKDDKPKELTQIEKTINNLYTDEKKLVYNNNDIYKIVYYYEEDEITGLEHYYEYKDEKEAEFKEKVRFITLEYLSSLEDVDNVSAMVNIMCKSASFDKELLDYVDDGTLHVLFKLDTFDK